MVTATIVSTSWLIKTLFVFLQTTKQTRIALNMFTFRTIAMEVVIVFLLVLSIVSMMLSLDQASPQSITGIGLAILLSATLPTYAFFIEPLVRLRGSNLTDITSDYSHLPPIRDNNIRIVETKSDLLNAYATGIIPYSRTIILGKRIRQQMTTNELESILYHEIGHLSKNHLLKLYLINLLVIGLGVVSFTFIRQAIENSSLPLLWVGLHGSAFAALLLFLSAAAQRSFEKQADVFAACATGSMAIIDALKKMDHLSGGQVSRKSLNYPTLQQRESYVKANVVSHTC